MIKEKGDDQFNVQFLFLDIVYIIYIQLLDIMPKLSKSLANIKRILF